jgi:hypothetical protein
MSKPTITTIAALRAAFWAAHPQFQPRIKRAPKTAAWRGLYVKCTQNDYPADIRVAWVDYVDSCNKDGTISDALAQRATL